MAPITGFKETKILIAAVRDRPALYNPKSAQYVDKEVKSQIWQEVFAILTPTWSDMTKDAKVKRGMLLNYNNLHGSAVHLKPTCILIGCGDHVMMTSLTAIS